METSLHRELKAFYCGDPECREVQLDGYRIDAVVGGSLVEIQQASLAAIRHKTKKLLENHEMIVVKPLAATTTILRLARRNGPVASKRTSPRHETLFDLFQELVHFVDVFPHPRLTLEVLLIEQQETRIPRPKRWFRARDYTLADRRLTAVLERHLFRTSADLCRLLPEGLSDTFTTGDLARLAGIPRWLAQKMTYCLRRSGAAAVVGKQRNTVLYTISPVDRAAA